MRPIFYEGLTPFEQTRCNRELGLQSMYRNFHRQALHTDTASDICARYAVRKARGRGRAPYRRERS